MLEWTVDPCIDRLGIPCGSESPITIVCIVAEEIINTAMVFSAIASNLTLRDGSGVKVDAGILLL